jgi:ferredoxin-NADP reductase
MFTHTLTRRAAPLLDLLLGPHGVDRYTELVDPMWTTETRGTVVAVRRQTPRSVTLVLAPNHPGWGGRAGQHVTLTVEIDGRRHSRCYSPANAEGDERIELTIVRHDGGLVSEYLHRNARPGMVVGLSAAAGDFVLPAPRPRRLVLIAGGSGITPVMAMVRTLHREGFDGELAVLHYVRSLADACYRDELTAMPGVRVLYRCTRDGDGDLSGHLDAAHLAAAMADPDAVYVCGPSALVDAARELCPTVVAESFAPRPFAVPESATGARITFSSSGIEADDDGRSLLEQAEAAGLTPRNGCRMGICHTCTRRKHRGAVRNLTTGAMSTADSEDVQICVSVPVGDVDIDL